MSSIAPKSKDNSQEKVSKKRKLVLLAFLLFTLFIFACDFVSKFYLERFLLSIPSKHYVIIPQVLDLTLAYNTGAAWSVLSKATQALGLFSLAVCGGLFAYVWHKASSLSYMQVFTFAAIAGGGLGNAYDRLARLAVVDFIDIQFFDFPIFNVADIAVSIGIFLLIISMFWDSYRN